MFPCCWITALIALLASFGVSFANLKIGLIVGIPTSIFILFLVFKKLKLSTKSCCSKEKINPM